MLMGQAGDGDAHCLLPLEMGMLGAFPRPPPGLHLSLGPWGAAPSQVTALCPVHPLPTTLHMVLSIGLFTPPEYQPCKG